MSLWDNQEVNLHSSKKLSAFTLIELMIVLVIAIVLSAIGYINITSRLKTARLEEAAQTLVSDLSYARSAAMLKGCPTRFIFCNDRTCSPGAGTAVVSGVNSDNRAVIGTNATPSVPARYYAIQRFSQADPSGTSSMCYNSAAIPSASDGYAYWDFDRRPQAIPQGVSFFPIYTSGGLADQTDWKWDQLSSAAAGNAIWFNSSGDLTSAAMTDTANVVGSAVDYRIVFQIGLDTCTPTNTDDCIAYLISIPANGGTAKFTKCESNTGNRSRGTTRSNRCF